MSFGGFGTGNTGFGAQNSSGFGFGNTSTPSAFGSNTNTSGLFGPSSTAPATGFGTGGGFGTPSAFGSGTNTSGFGSGGTSSGLFGASTAANTTNASGFGTFGTAANNTTSGFGQGNNSVFGQNKPNAFGATSGSVFGSNANNSTATGAFGTTATGAFGAPASTALSSAVGDPPGTAVVNFVAFQEKETNGTNNSFQNILFQDAYKKWSSEELRLVDYVQGRRFGNASGVGAFGVGTAFGGTGFGTNTNNTTGFGSNTNTGTSSVFGNTAAGGTTGFGATATTNAFGGNNNAFGQNKLGQGFGATNTTNAFGTLGGGFATNNTNLGGFGTNNNNSNPTNNNTSGLFGGGNQNQDNKPTGFGFANTGTTGFGSTSNNLSGFGALANTGNSGFGAVNNTGGGGFGNTTTPTNTGFGFGNTNNNNANGSTLLGGTNNQAKPSGFFANNNATLGNGMFGNTTSNGDSGGSGFGAIKTDGGLGGTLGASFGQQNTGTGSGLFGIGQGNTQPQQQQATGSDMFNLGQNKPSAFGSTTQNGSSMFGQPQNNNQIGTGSTSFASTFGQQPTTGGLGSSLLGNSQNTSQGGGAALTTTINDLSAYGSSSLFADRGNNEPHNPGPLATPLSSSVKPRRTSILPMYKLNPVSASRITTPQKRGGFGFSYSAYGSPGSFSSSVSGTPTGQNLLSGGSLRLSHSASPLRASSGSEDSILTPGAFSSSRQRSVKKLVINRDIRSDLFASPAKSQTSFDPARSSRLRKHVSFDDSADADSEPRLALPAPPSNDPDASPSGNQSVSSEARDTQDSPSNVGKKRTHSAADSSFTTSVQSDDSGNPTPGRYWMQPCLDEIMAMSRSQRSAVPEFIVGRENVGSVRFLEAVDLSSVDIENLFGDTIELLPRNATVYKNAAKKPPVGKGMNVPAEIKLEHSWPRQKKSDKRAVRMQKHIERLKRIPDTTFIDFSDETGVWTFRVEHFTTYGPDYSDDENDEPNNDQDASKRKASSTQPSQHNTQGSANASQPSRDTAEQDGSSKDGLVALTMPGSFEHEPRKVARSDRKSVVAGTPVKKDVSLNKATGDGGEKSNNQQTIQVSVAADIGVDDAHESENEDLFLTEMLSDHVEVPAETPGGIMRARMRAIRESTYPQNLRVADGNDWQDMLRRTITPQKRDRVLLKTLNASAEHGAPLQAPETRQKSVVKMKGFATSIDVMKSLFERPKAFSEHSDTSKGFAKWPYERQKKMLDETDLPPQEQAFHKTIRPSWGPNGTLVFAATPRPFGQSSYRSKEKMQPGILEVRGWAVSSETHEIRIAKFAADKVAHSLREHIRLTQFDGDGKSVPTATLSGLKSISSVACQQTTDKAASFHEKLVWDLASILFDDITVAADVELTATIEASLRRQKLASFWQTLVDDATTRGVAMAKSPEDKAMACLAGRRIDEACKHLIAGRNFRLATLVATIGTSDIIKQEMTQQLDQWRAQHTLSEFSDTFRAIYSLVAGQTYVCEGNESGPNEHRMPTFSISRRFGLDWKQAFGLQLWYSLMNDDDIGVAVRSFHNHLASGETKPSTWFVMQDIAPIWEDARLEEREDILWGLLKLCGNPQADLEAVLRPENSQLSPLDHRLSWQLGRVLTATGKATFGTNSSEKADAATLSLAAQLASEGSWLEATFVLLHLSDPVARTRAVKDHLARHAMHIGNADSAEFTTLFKTFRVPAAWLWEAKALYMRSAKRYPVLELLYLLDAGAFDEAHDTLVTRVAPHAIIQRDYSGLMALLKRFARYEDRISRWRRGGEVYRDFLRLLAARQSSHIDPQVLGQLVDRLVDGLALMKDEHVTGRALGDGSAALTKHMGATTAGGAAGGGGGGVAVSTSNEGIEATAAITEMGSIVASTIIDMTRGTVSDNTNNHNYHAMSTRVLGLPLTEDSLLSHSIAMSFGFFNKTQSIGA